MDKLSELFKKCLDVEYIHVAESADYYIETEGKRLYIYLQCSNGIEDWINNFDFPISVYKRENDKRWFCHRGFLRAFSALMPYVKESIDNFSIDSCTVVGYSHGGALAILCYEYIWFWYPELRDNLIGYGFGAPRVLFGKRDSDFINRWRNFKVIRNLDDIVTHLPPVVLGYFHASEVLNIGERGKYSCIDAHRPENILRELMIFEQGAR